MGAIHELNMRMQSFVNDLPNQIEQSILFVEADILNLNREQLKERQVTSLDNPVLPEYSTRWKAIKGLVYPNLYDTGNFQKRFVLNVKYPNYLIKSLDRKNEKLTAKYGEEIFGIAPSNQPKAKAITSNAIGKRLKSIVFKNL